MKLLTLQGTFLDDVHNPSFDQAAVVLLGVSFDATASYKKGARFGPYAILDASYQLEHEMHGSMRVLSEDVVIHSLGILEQEELSSDITEAVAHMHAQVRMRTQPVFDAHKVLMMFGGEHSVTLGALQALKNVIRPEDVTVVSFDAHLDMRNEFDNTKLSHACVLRRVHELGFPVLAVGVRDRISAEERAYVAEHQIPVWYCSTRPQTHHIPMSLQDGRISHNQIQAICQAVTTPYVYITLDIDCLDPSFAPGTGTPTPYGLQPMSVQAVLARLLQTRTPLGFDVVEVAPQMCCCQKAYHHNKCVSTITETTAAELAYFILEHIRKK